MVHGDYFTKHDKDASDEDAVEITDNFLWEVDASILYGLKRKAEEYRKELAQEVHTKALKLRECYPVVIAQLEREYAQVVGSFNSDIARLDAEAAKWRKVMNGLRRRDIGAEIDQQKAEKNAAYNHPWVCNTNHVFNTSAYSAKLVGLSAQLEALQSGAFHHPTRLLTG